jgi:adenosylcobinamide-phosphate synthase
MTVYWAYSMLAVRDLDVESGAVIKELRRGDLTAARRKLSHIVGRDTSHLDEQEMLRAVIETVAENISDGVVAPLFYFTLAGPAGMAVYKATNTLDSMVGYKSERYRDFGWAAARLDDVLNFVPARLTAVLIWAASACLGLDLRRSVQAVWRDAWRQPSPNAGYPEAAVAGALQVRLGGLNYYGGTPSRKPPLGDPGPLTADSFQAARRMLYVTSILAVALSASVLSWRQP